MLRVDQEVEFVRACEIYGAAYPLWSYPTESEMGHMKPVKGAIELWSALQTTASRRRFRAASDAIYNAGRYARPARVTITTDSHEGNSERDTTVVVDELTIPNVVEMGISQRRRRGKRDGCLRGKWPIQVGDRDGVRNRFQAVPVPRASTGMGVNAALGNLRCFAILCSLRAPPFSGFLR